MSNNRVKWGVLGVASIATRKVIAGMATTDERRQAQQAASASQATYARIFKDRT
jgi:hypothetical protein